MSAPTILFVSGWLRSTVPADVQGMVLVSRFDFVHCLLCLPLGPSERVSPVGWPQSEKSGKQASYGVPDRRRGVGVGSGVLGQAFPIRETARRRLVPKANAPVEEVGRRG